MSAYQSTNQRGLKLGEGIIADMLNPSRIKHFLLRKSLLAARHIITFSEWARTLVINDYNIYPDKVTRIAPGVDTARFVQPPKRPADKIGILFIGNDFPRKGGDLLLKWIEESGRGLGCELHLVTRAGVEPRPGVFVHNNVTPNSDELLSIMSGCHIFAFPTRADCFPLALIEAMGTGLAVVATNITAIPEIVDDGQTGLLIAPDCYEEMSATLRRLVLNVELRERLGRAARLRVETDFSMKQYQRVVECVLQSTGGGNNRPNSGPGSKKEILPAIQRLTEEEAGAENEGMKELHNELHRQCARLLGVESIDEGDVRDSRPA